MTASSHAEPAAAAVEPAATDETARSATWREWLGGPWTGPIVTVVGSLVILVAGLLPVWGTRLIAPQYPKGLELWFYGNRVEGPVGEVNGLNHYIGMQTIDLSQVPEMVLWPLAVVGSTLLLVIAVLWRGWLSRLALLGLWLVPVVVLVDIQRWLYVFGQELDPRAALEVGGFVPLAVGPTDIWNFTVLTYPGPALILIWAVALVATLARRAKVPEPRVRWVSSAIALALAAVGTVLLVPIGSVEAASPDGAAQAPGGGSATASIDIQALVDEAPPHSTVLVPAGAYRTNLVVDKPLTLVAQGDVYLDGGGQGSVVTISADDVTMRGFSVASTGGQLEDAAAIKIIEADGVTIEDNVLADFFHGISGLSATNLRIADNTITGAGQVSTGASHFAGADDGTEQSPGDEDALAAAADDNERAFGAEMAGPRGQGDAIYLWNSEAVTIADNTIGRVRDGVYLAFASDVLIDSNDVGSSRYAFHSMFGGPVTVFGNEVSDNLAGLVFMYTEDVLAGRNLITDQRSAATGFGIVLKDVEGVRLAENVIARNRVGMLAEGTRARADTEATVVRNRFDSNDMAVSLYPSADMGFGANTFEDNLTDVHAEDRGVARQNDWAFEGTGNRWSGYAGYDLDGDGVGDIPHDASGALQIILTEVPALQLYRGSPALHALDSAQELWEADRAVLVHDPAPRIDDHAPRTEDLDPGVVVAGSVGDEAVGWYAVGVSLALLALLGMALGRIRRRGELA